MKKQLCKWVGELYRALGGFEPLSLTPTPERRSKEIVVLSADYRYDLSDNVSPDWIKSRLSELIAREMIDKEIVQIYCRDTYERDRVMQTVRAIVKTVKPEKLSMYAPE